MLVIMALLVLIVLPVSSWPGSPARFQRCLIFCLLDMTQALLLRMTSVRVLIGLFVLVCLLSFLAPYLLRILLRLGSPLRHLIMRGVFDLLHNIVLLTLFSRPIDHLRLVVSHHCILATLQLSTNIRPIREIINLLFSGFVLLMHI